MTLEPAGSSGDILNIKLKNIKPRRKVDSPFSPETETAEVSIIEQPRSEYIEKPYDEFDSLHPEDKNTAHTLKDMLGRPLLMRLFSTN